MLKLVTFLQIVVHESEDGFGPFWRVFPQPIEWDENLPEHVQAMGFELVWAEDVSMTDEPDFVLIVIDSDDPLCDARSWRKHELGQQALKSWLVHNE